MTICIFLQTVTNAFYRPTRLIQGNVFLLPLGHDTLECFFLEMQLCLISFHALFIIVMNLLFLCITFIVHLFLLQMMTPQKKGHHSPVSHSENCQMRCMHVPRSKPNSRVPK